MTPVPGDFTLVFAATGRWFNYRLRPTRQKDGRWVTSLSKGRVVIGKIDDRDRFWRRGEDSDAQKAFEWWWPRRSDKVSGVAMIQAVPCEKCRRLLYDPARISLGVGKECER